MKILFKHYILNICRLVFPRITATKYQGSNIHEIGKILDFRTPNPMIYGVMLYDIMKLAFDVPRIGREDGL